jgi:Transposase DDE domain/Transposase domain (DUF772)
MSEKSKRRPPKSFRPSPQHEFALTGATERELPARHPIDDEVRQFTDGDPLALYVGAKRIDVWLKEFGLGSIFTVRRLLEAMDWTPFYQRYRPQGRPPYHPRLMAGVIVLGHLLGRTSLRELEILCATDMRCWWLTGGKVPDYSSFCNFFARHQDLWTEHFFEDLTTRIVRALGSDGSFLATDGTVTLSAASTHKRLSVEAAQHKASQAREAANGVPRETPAQKKTAASLEKKAEQAERVAKIAKQRDDGRSAKQKRASATLVAPSDPEAVTQILKRGGFGPAYQPSIAVTKDRVITATSVHPSNEIVQVSRLLDQSERTTGVVPDIVAMDARYNTGPMLEEALRRELNLLCPSGRTFDPDGDWTPDTKQIHKSKFRYDEKTDSYRCPQGRALPKVKSKQAFDEYQSPDCSDCPLRSQCVRSGDKGRVVSRTSYDELREALQHVMTQPGARAAYRRRQGMVEPVFGETQQIQGMRRFRRRGLPKVRGEWALHCAAHNVRRLLARLQRRPGGSICRSGRRWPGIQTRTAPR